MKKEFDNFESRLIHRLKLTKETVKFLSNLKERQKITEQVQDELVDWFENIITKAYNLGLGQVKQSLKEVIEENNKKNIGVKGTIESTTLLGNREGEGLYIKNRGTIEYFEIDRIEKAKNDIIVKNKRENNYFGKEKVYIFEKEEETNLAYNKLVNAIKENKNFIEI